MNLIRASMRLRPLSAENVPKRKTYLYILVIFVAVILFYLYSFPVEINTNIFVFKDDQTKDMSVISDNASSNTTEDMLTIRVATSAKESTLSVSDVTKVQEGKYTSITQLVPKQTLVTETLESQNTFTSSREFSLPSESLTSEAGVSTKLKSFPTLAKARLVETNSDTTVKSDATLTHTNTKSAAEEVSSANSSDGRGFLVFSKNCKIPDIDPMHPSIKRFVWTNPPLNCTKEEPITKTEGNLLILDTEAAERRGFKNFTCCYKSVYRDREGFSDNQVGFGNCVIFNNTAKIADEFITVICFYNKSVLYQEFHSFIHDKPSVEERCEKEKTPPYSVMIVGIDGISRLNMHRQMKRTVKFLVENMGAVEMMGFNKIGDNTFPNLVATLLGYDERELSNVCWNSESKESLDKCNFLWKRFAKKGYRTLYSEDTPYMSSFNYIKMGFYQQPTDYYSRHFMLAYEDTLGWKKEANCHLCVGSVSETEAVLHWVKLFASHFRDKPYFSLSWINSMTHDYLNSGSGVDHVYENFFSSLHQSGALNRTIVIVMADHGIRWGSIRKTFLGRLEERLPMLFIALPPEFQTQYPKETNTLKLNSRRLVTPFDLHATLLNVLHLKDEWTFSNSDNVTEELSSNFTKRAHSLFQDVPKDRSCDDAFIDEHWCTCEDSLPMDKDNANVQIVSTYIVKHINSLLKSVSNVCATLNLSSIIDARILSPSSAHTGHTEEDNIYTLIVETNPGGAIFEGTVRISPPKYDCELLGSISRLNLYGKQSICVNDAILKKYCFCSKPRTSSTKEK